MVNEDIFFIVATVDVYVTIVVDTNDFEGTFGWCGEFGSFGMLIFLL